RHHLDDQVADEQDRHDPSGVLEVAQRVAAEIGEAQRVALLGEGGEQGQAGKHRCTVGAGCRGYDFATGSAGGRERRPGRALVSSTMRRNRSSSVVVGWPMLSSLPPCLARTASRSRRSASLSRTLLARSSSRAASSRSVFTSPSSCNSPS